MKAILFAAFAGLLCFCTSCTGKTDTTSNNSDNNDMAQKQKNMAASDAISKAFQTGDASALDSVVADDFLDHTDRGDFKGRDSLKAMVNWVHANMKDMKTEKVHDAAEGDYVYSWMRYSGTSDGSMGMPKGPYTMNSIEVGKFKDGKAVEHWNFMEIRDAMKMMAPQPQPGINNMNNSNTMNNKDSGKMKK